MRIQQAVFQAVVKSSGYIVYPRAHHRIIRGVATTTTSNNNTTTTGSESGGPPDVAESITPFPEFPKDDHVSRVLPTLPSNRGTRNNSFQPPKGADTSTIASIFAGATDRIAGNGTVRMDSSTEREGVSEAMQELRPPKKHVKPPPAFRKPPPMVQRQMLASVNAAQTTEEVWRAITNKLLDGRIRSVVEFENVIKHWWSRQHTPESAVVLWQLWDAMPKSETKMQMLELVLKHWRFCIKDGVRVPLVVKQVWYRIKDLPLESRCYSMILSALSDESLPNFGDQTVDFAERILQHYLEHYNTASEKQDDPAQATVVWNSVLTVIAKSGSVHAGAQAEEVMQRMKRAHVPLNEISYACVLEAWASCAKADYNAAKQADRVLEEMVRELGTLAHRKQPTGELDPIKVSAAGACYLHTLIGWSQANLEGGVEKANLILENMVHSYLADEPLPNYYPRVKPSRHCFSAVMTGYARRGMAPEVERLLTKLQDLYYKSDGDDMFRPRVSTFNSVFEAYARQKSPSSAEKAQQLLERMVATAESQADVGLKLWPDTSSVNACILAWADSGAPDAIERADALLEKSWDWPGVKPDSYSYTTVMKAYSLSDLPDAAERCERMLKNMWENYEKDPTHIEAKPNQITYSTVIFAWSRSHAYDAPIQAEKIYNQMLERGKNGDLSLVMTPGLYNSLITVWAMSLRPEAEARAQFYFDQMRGKYMSGVDRLRPDSKLYSALICGRRKRQDGEGAERILKQMYDDYLNHGNPSARPNRRVFHNVMMTWATSNHPDAVERIEALLQQMEHEKMKRDWETRPTDKSFTILINCLAKIGTREAVERSESVLEHMHYLGQKYTDIKPTNFTYGTVIGAWSNIAKTEPDAPARAQKLYDKMLHLYRSGDVAFRPTSHADNALLTTWARSSHDNAGPRSFELLREIEHRRTADKRNKDELPNHFHYSAVVNAFANSGDVAGMEKTFNRMKRRGDIRPQTALFNAMIKGYHRSGLRDAPEKAEQALRMVKDFDGLSPDAVTYTAVLSCLYARGAAGDYEKGKSLVDEMIILARDNKEARPTAATFGLLLSILTKTDSAKVDKPHEADEIVSRMNMFDIEASKGLTNLLMKLGHEATLNDPEMRSAQAETLKSML